MRIARRREDALHVVWGSHAACAAAGERAVDDRKVANTNVDGGVGRPGCLHCMEVCVHVHVHGGGGITLGCLHIRGD